MFYYNFRKICSRSWK